MSVVKPSQKVTLESRVFEALCSSFPEFQCTITDIKFPKKDFVINFYLFMLEQLRFNTNYFTSDLVSEQLAGESHPEMLRSTLQLVNLSKALRTIMNKLCLKDGLQFGLNDLVDPSPARNSSFMFTLLNFFSFADQRVVELSDKLEIIGERKSFFNELLEKREKLCRELNSRAERKLQLPEFTKMINEKKLEIASISEESTSLEKLNDIRQKELEEVNRHFGRVRAEGAELLQSYQKLQALQVQSPDVLQHNYKQLQEKLKETKLQLEQAHEVNKEKKKKLVLCETVSKQLENRLTFLKDIINQAKEVKKLNSDFADLDSKYKSDIAVTEASQLKVNGLKKELSRLTAQLTTLQLQHEKTKSSMKESIRHLLEEHKVLEDQESTEMETILESSHGVQKEISELIKENNKNNEEYEKLYAYLIKQEQDFCNAQTKAIEDEIKKLKEVTKPEF